MELMKENQPPAVNAGWNNDGPGGLDLLVKAATQKSSQPKKSKAPTMALNGSYDTPVIVGRGSQATLNLGRVNKQVSRRHAIIQWCAESSTFEITVLGQNGVRINGTGFPSGQQATLRGGDIVDLVGVKMLFRTPTTPPPAHPQQHQDYQDDDLSSQDAPFEDFHEDQVYADPVGLVTPKRPQYSTSIHHQLATPGTSSPAPRDTMGSPSQLTPTARMRHKMLKYDLSSSPSRNNVYQTPPSAKSDAGTGYSASPVKPPPVFAIPFDAMPNRSNNAPSLPSSPSSEPNFFMDDSAALNPFRVPSERAPLAPLALAENSSVKVAKPSSQDSTTQRAPGAASESPLSKSPKKNNTKLVSAKSGTTPQSTKSTSGVKDIEHLAPVAKEPTQKSSKPNKEKENHNAKKEVKTKAPSSASAPIQSNKTKDAVTKSTSSSTAAVKAPKAKTAPKEKIAAATPAAVKESAVAKQESTSSSRESSPDAPTTTTKSSGDKEPRDYTEMIIDTLVFARKKKSMTLTELFDEMITSQPSLMATHDAEEIKEQMLECLSAARCVGKITRKGKDAYNKPLENQWYYIPECDHNVMRKLTRQEVMPSARKCTLKDKQYFFKMPPKLPYHRKSTSPYAVKPSARRTKEPSKLSTAHDDEDDADNADGSLSSSSSDLDDDVDDQPVSTTLNRKRKSNVAGHVDKKRKASSSAPSASKASSTSTAATSGSGSKDNANDDDDEEDDEDDGHNDSLDDLSELSGLSD